MTTIYLVTSGDYSDYGIDGVYSTREKAQAHVDAITGTYHVAEVEEHELDAPFNPETAYWQVTVNDEIEGFLAKRDTAEFHQSINSNHDVNAVWRVDIRSYGTLRSGERGPTSYSRWYVYVRAPDRDSALKIGQDLIAAFRAEQAMWESL